MKDILNYKILSLGKDMDITVKTVIAVLLTLLIARIIIWFLGKVFTQYATQRKIDKGRQHSIFQIIKYIIYFITLLFILNALDIDSMGLLVSSGALLVGVGIGLQQTFNDIFSGIILLFESSVKVGDKLIVDDLICQVRHIGLRTTEVTTIDNISIIIPNSILVTNKVTNWSHNQKSARFHIDVGVAYSSDIEFVEKVLLDSLNGQSGIQKFPAPSVQLMNYGDSSVDFRLYFFSREFFEIKKIKSDIRKRIFKNFKENNIEIPFPQRDLWVKNIPQ
ncbi:MAG: mechanosensitive ion channel [Flavobacteriaceae bacterium]|nr:mechanosensitive ion channel [Flavobacteriaceae bacterium]